MIRRAVALCASQPPSRRAAIQLLVAALLCTSASASGQTSKAGAPGRPVTDLQGNPGGEAAAPADVGTIDGIVGAFAAAVSATPGGKLDRGRLRALFVPSGRIVISVPPRPDRAADVAILSPDGYADLSDHQTAREGFNDRVIGNKVERFGIMAHVYSAYESRHVQTDAQPFTRGVKSLELLNSGGRYYIVQVYYDWERAGNPIPQDVLRNDQR